MNWLKVLVVSLLMRSDILPLDFSHSKYNVTNLCDYKEGSVNGAYSTCKVV